MDWRITLRCIVMSYELFVLTNGLVGARRAKNVPFFKTLFILKNATPV